MIQKLLHIHCSKDLSFNFACILAKFPMSEKKYEIFQKADPKKRFGIISRHCMSVGHKCGLSDDFLGFFVEVKEDYRFYKKWHAENLADKHKKEFKELMDALKTEHRAEFVRRDLQHLTFKLVKYIVNSKIFKEKEWPTE